VLLALIAVYRVALSPFAGGHCRFYPSCSAYAEQAIRNTGAVRGLGLTAWRILRCSPLSAGGIDHPPGPMYDAVTPPDARRPEVTA
jgi:putative membrane protein insertion efficiency factor